MAELATFKLLRDNIASVVRDTQISDLIDSLINLTGQEIHNFHPWTWKRRKQTFSTVADQEDYNLDSEIDWITLLRQRSTPVKLRYVPDQFFYQLVPNPEDTGSGISRYYRLWGETGFSTNLAAADTIYVVSSSASDGSSFTVRVVGRNSSGEVVAETLTLNGITNVTSTTTFATDGLMTISKSASTTGTISCYRTTGATLLSELEPDNLSPRFKRISLYPIPSAVVTMYVEYLERYRAMIHNTDTPQLPVQWIWVLREGALAKVCEYKQNAPAAAQHQGIFDRGLRFMREQDERNLDYVPALRPRSLTGSVVHLDSDSVNNNFPSYSVGWP